MPLLFSRKNQDQLLAAAAAATGQPVFAPDAHAFAVLEGNKLRAIFVFERIEGDTATMHLCSVQPFRPTREMIFGFFTVAARLGYANLRAEIATWNTPSLVFALRIGMTIKGYLGGSGEHEVDVVLLHLADTARRGFPPPQPNPDTTQLAPQIGASDEE